MRAVAYFDCIQSVAFDIWYMVAHSVWQGWKLLSWLWPSRICFENRSDSLNDTGFSYTNNIILISETARCQTGKWPCIFPQHTYQSSGENAIFFLSFSVIPYELHDVLFKNNGISRDIVTPRPWRLLSSSWRSGYIVACSQKRSVLSVVGRVVRDQDYVDITPGPHLNIKTVFTGMAIPIIKIRRSSDRGIFIKGILILVRRLSLYWDAPQIPSDTGSRAFSMKTMFPQSACILLLHIHRSWNHSRSSWRQCFCDWRISCWCIFIVPEITPDLHGDNVSAIGAYLVGAYSLFLQSNRF